jgi:hypothetical protein
MTTWNKYQEGVLKKWSSMSKTYSTMHSIAAEYYSTWDKRLGIPVILLGAAAASSIFTTSAESDTNNIWAYINGGMVLLMTGISGVSKFLGTNEKKAKHTSASFKYTHISMNIDTLLSFPRKDREEQPRQFINEIKLAILEVREHTPDLPTGLVSDYIKKLDKSLTNTRTKVNRHTGHHRNTSVDPYGNLSKLNEWNSMPYKRDSVCPPISDRVRSGYPSPSDQYCNEDQFPKPEPEHARAPLPDLSDTEAGAPASDRGDSNTVPPSPEKKVKFVENQPTPIGDVVVQIHGHSGLQRRRGSAHSPSLPYRSSTDDSSGIGDDLYTDFLESPDITKKMEHISEKLQYQDSQSESDSGSENE